MRGSRQPNASPEGLLAPCWLSYTAAIFTLGRRHALHPHSPVVFLLVFVMFPWGHQPPFSSLGFCSSAVRNCAPSCPLDSPETLRKRSAKPCPCWKLGCVFLEILLCELGHKWFPTRRCCPWLAVMWALLVNPHRLPWAGYKDGLS